MPSPFPSQPNARANAGWDETRDWATSDYPDFEKAVNSGAPIRRQVARAGGGEVIKTASRKEPSPRDINRFLRDEAGLTLGEAARLSARMLGYGLKHKEDREIARGMLDDDPRAITRQQDAANRRFLQSIQNDPAGQRSLQKYNEAFTNGKLRLIP